MKVKLTLTLDELDMLDLVIGNGWGDGDFANWLGDAKKVRLCKSAMAKVNDAQKLARLERDRAKGRFLIKRLEKDNL